MVPEQPEEGQICSLKSTCSADHDQFLQGKRVKLTGEHPAESMQQRQRECEADCVPLILCCSVINASST